MKSLLTATVLTCALALALPPAPAQAGDDMTGSDVSVLVVGFSAMMVVSGPVLLSAAGVNSISEASSSAKDEGDKPRRRSAGAVPDMKVTAVGDTVEGGRRVALEDPTNPENTAVLSWPKRQDDPAAGFHIGSTIVFQPSPQGAGWLLHDQNRTALAFVPTMEAASESHTATF